MHTIVQDSTCGQLKQSDNAKSCKEGEGDSSDSKHLQAPPEQLLAVDLLHLGLDNFHLLWEQANYLVGQVQAVWEKVFLFMKYYAPV